MICVHLRLIRGGGSAAAAAPAPALPKGNLNALKHGRYSKQFAIFGALLAGNPSTRDRLLEWAARMDLKYRKVEDITEVFSGRLMQHARRHRPGDTLPGPFAGLLKVRRRQESQTKGWLKANS